MQKKQKIRTIKKKKISPTILLLTARGLTFQVFNKVFIIFNKYLLRA